MHTVKQEKSNSDEYSLIRWIGMCLMSIVQVVEKTVF